MAETSEVQHFNNFGKNKQFCDRKYQLGSAEKGAMLTSNEEAGQAANTSIANQSQFFLCMVLFSTADYPIRL